MTARVTTQPLRLPASIKAEAERLAQADGITLAQALAKARGLSDATVKALVTKYTQGRTIGFLGEPRVDVLTLNIALDKLSK